MNERNFIYFILPFLFLIALSSLQLTDYCDPDFRGVHLTQIEENIHEIADNQDDDNCLFQQTSRNRKFILHITSDKLDAFSLFYYSEKVNFSPVCHCHNQILRSALCIYRI